MQEDLDLLDEKYGPVETPGEQDYWTVTHEVAVRYHISPREKMYAPTEDDCPIFKYLDVLRVTTTTLDTPSEARIEDTWCNDAANRTLSGDWTGTTIFHILRPEPPHGWEWQSGRLTKTMVTTRSPTIWPGVWQMMSQKQRQQSRESWEVLKRKVSAERKEKGDSELYSRR